MATPMRAKLRITEVKRVGSVEQPIEVISMSAVCKPNGYDATGLDEDNTFAKFSPSASFVLTCQNPALCGKFNPGEVYYADFTPVPDAK